jgi:GT2 family glycosyltransferase
MKDHKVLIAVPALDVMPVQTAYSMLSLKRDCPSRFSFIVRASCHDARNLLAREAIESGADRVLWIDSDMVFGEDLMIRFGEDLDAGWDMVCGSYFKRELPVTPVIYTYIDPKAGKAEAYLGYPKDAVFQVAGCGFGAVMMNTELLRRVGDYPFTPLPHLSEDLSFCKRATDAGARIVCDSRIKVGHVGQIVYGEQMYKHPGG